MKCNKDGCNAEARALPKVSLPYQGGPLIASKCPNMIFDIYLCHDHVKSFPLDADILHNSAFLQGMNFAFGMRADRLPDFERIFADSVVIGSTEHTNYINLQKKQ
jgi:hypothetical protein